jgi:putative ABC transport system permease protein
VTVKTLSFLREVVQMALRDLSARPLRSVLSMSSFTCSMAITVVLIAAGDGLRSAVGEILRNLGEGQIMVTPGRTTGVGGQRRAGRQVRLRYEDVEELGKKLSSMASIAPYFDLRGGGASSWRYSIPWSPVKAVAREYLEVRQLPVREGRWFTAAEENEGRWVAVLNEGLRRIIFPDTAAVGQTIHWRGRHMTVVGVVRDEALFPYMLFIPYRTVSQLTDARYITGLIARPAPGESWDRAVGEVRRVLAGLGSFEPGDENALEIEDNREFTARVGAASRALHLLVITIAGVSLLLGGLGVANMMVIAVTERTREIGLRKALGATPRSIFIQILSESLVIIGIGGAAGTGLGALACGIVGHLEISARYAAEIGFDPGAALVALLGLSAVGILAGVIPARRAAALPAAEALRWE